MVSKCWPGSQTQRRATVTHGRCHKPEVAAKVTLRCHVGPATSHKVFPREGLFDRVHTQNVARVWQGSLGEPYTIQGRVPCPFPWPLDGAMRSSSLTMRKRLGFAFGWGVGAVGSSRRGSMAEPPFDVKHGLQFRKQTLARLADPTPGHRNSRPHVASPRWQRRPFFAAASGLLTRTTYPRARLTRSTVCSLQCRSCRWGAG